MAGIDDNVALSADWGLPIPSPRTIFSKLLDEVNVARPPILETPGSARTDELLEGSHDPIAAGKSNIKNRLRDGASVGQLADPSSLSEQKLSSRGGLVERMAARAGYNAPRLNTESIRPADLSLNSDVQSPYLTIPPGLSPTTLLGSPMFLSNSLAQPSPTTGKFLFTSNDSICCSELSSDAPEKSKDNGFDDIYSSTFAFKPATDLGPSFYHGAARKMNSTTLPNQSLPGIEVSVQSENYFQSQGVDSVKDSNENKSGLRLQADFIDFPLQKDNATNFFSTDQRALDTVGGGTEHSAPLEELEDEDRDPGSNGDSMIAGVGGAPSEDGYNWRKYGQKQVKGSEYPRSYYKCTHPNCQVKKKVERSHEGHITEIIYKGVHSHPKPPPNRRSAIGSVNPLVDKQMNISEHVEPESGNNGDLHQTSVQKVNVAGAAEWKHDHREMTSASAVPVSCNQSSNLQTQNDTNFESGDAIDMSSTFSNDEDEDDRGTHGSVSLGYDGEGDESESKRRKLESYSTELSGATRAIREPRVVVQTTSEVDILDDGYRWRKYGQKVVKGNPNPRSYYKCTNAGCTVRKHVERASHDVKAVITTYEGKHNHDVPAARTSSHVNAAAGSSTVAAQASTGIQTHHFHNHRSEASQVQIGGIGSLKRPAALPLGSFNLPGRPQLVPSHGFSFGMSNDPMPGFGPPAQPKLPLMSVPPFLAQQQRSPNEMGFLMPKGEPNVKPTPERGLNLPGCSSVYQEIMSRMQHM